MNEEKARKILGGFIADHPYKTDSLRKSGYKDVFWNHGKDIYMNGSFSLYEIEAILWWMKNKKE
jgi:hypothetical protein